MKSGKIIRFSDLSVNEKLMLTDEEVERLIDLECAFEGLNLSLTRKNLLNRR